MEGAANSKAISWHMCRLNVTTLPYDKSQQAISCQVKEVDRDITQQKYKRLTQIIIRRIMQSVTQKRFTEQNAVS